jgi:hypothetical protein
MKKMLLTTAMSMLGVIVFALASNAKGESNPTVMCMGKDGEGRWWDLQGPGQFEFTLRKAEMGGLADVSVCVGNECLKHLQNNPTPLVVSIGESKKSMVLFATESKPKSSSALRFAKCTPGVV